MTNDRPPAPAISGRRETITFRTAVVLYFTGLLIVAVSTDSVALVLAIAFCWGVGLRVLLTAITPPESV